MGMGIRVALWCLIGTFNPGLIGQDFYILCTLYIALFVPFPYLFHRWLLLVKKFFSVVSALWGKHCSYISFTNAGSGIPSRYLLCRTNCFRTGGAARKQLFFFMITITKRHNRNITIISFYRFKNKFLLVWKNVKLLLDICSMFVYYV